MIVEPLVQGAAGMLVAAGRLPARGARAVRRHGVFLICDEVATGFGRTGTMFACEQEGVTPDFMCVAKGITGGYLPLAATLTTERVYEGFLGAHERVPDLLPRPHVHGQPARLRRRARDARRLRGGAHARAPAAEDRAARRAARRARRAARRRRRDPPPRLHGRHRADRASRSTARMGHQVTLEARARGAIVRPLGDTIVLMPPLAIEPRELAGWSRSPPRRSPPPRATRWPPRLTALVLIVRDEVLLRAPQTGQNQSSGCPRTRFRRIPPSGSPSTGS